VVDSANRQEIEASKDALMRTLTVAAQISLLVFANKQDIPTAMTLDEIIEGLKLNDLPGDHEWHVQPCSAKTGAGLNEGLDWICNQVKQVESSPAPEDVQRLAFEPLKILKKQKGEKEQGQWSPLVLLRSIANWVI
jgi:hypothetical protein